MDGSPFTAADTLVGDIRDAMLGRIQRQAKPWPSLSEQEQRDTIEGITNAAKTLVARAVKIVATKGFESTVASLKELKIKGEVIEGKVIAMNISTVREMLGDAAGSEVIIVFAAAETFYGESQPAEPEPDEPGLPGIEHQP